jgi:hypothetical protein
VAKRRAVLATAVAAAVSATLAVPAPARAADTVGAFCSARDNALILDATAYFIGGGDEPTHTWTLFKYTLWGNMGNRSDVNIFMHAPSLVWTKYNKDNRGPGTWHDTPNPPLRTTASESEIVLFQAVFDKFGPDPSCLAWSPAV